MIESELGEIPAGWELTDVKAATTELRIGISPKYTEEHGIQVINQKCIRNHTINFELTRLNDPLKRKIEGKQVELGDVLVNSTGVGTLGRLAPVRYLPAPTVFDSHVTVVRANTTAISKFTTIDKRRTDEEKNSALKQIIDNAIIAEGVDDIFSLVGLDKPNIK